MTKNDHSPQPGTAFKTLTPELLTKPEAAKMLGIKVRTLDDWRASRTIPCIERGHYVRFLRRDIEDFLMAHRVEAKPRPAHRRRSATAKPLAAA